MTLNGKPFSIVLSTLFVERCRLLLLFFNSVWHQVTAFLHCKLFFSFLTLGFYFNNHTIEMEKKKAPTHKNEMWKKFSQIGLFDSILISVSFSLVILQLIALSAALLLIYSSLQIQFNRYTWGEREWWEKEMYQWKLTFQRKKKNKIDWQPQAKFSTFWLDILKEQTTFCYSI